MVLVGGSIVDMAGVARAKYVPAARLEAFHTVGMGASPSWSVFCVDGSIAFTPELGVVGDNRIRIDPANLRTLDDGVGWAPGDFHLQDGEPSPMCGRLRLAAVVEEAARAGLSARVGAELECTLLAEDGSHASRGTWSPYGLRTSLERSAFLLDVTTAAERAGLGVEQLHMEYGPDQFEMSLSPTDPVSAADDVVLARAVIGRVAGRHGLLVSFSPLPFAGEAGNGAHLHLSLTDADGSPVFEGGDGPRGLTPTGEAAIAGVLDALPGLIGVYAGSALSQRRLLPGNWAGAAVCWGLENREAAVRLVRGGSASAHGANIELKVVDPSANPYLAIAALLGSACRGVELSLPLPEEVSVHPSEAGLEFPPLPVHQAAAIDGLEESTTARELLGPAIVRGVVAVRRRESETFAGLPVADTAEALRMAWSC